MSSPVVSAGPDDVGKRRRLLLVVASGVVVAGAFGAVSSYSEHQVSKQDARVRQRAAVASVAPTVIMDSAYGEDNEIATDLGVSADRVTLTADGSEPCITIRSSYLVAKRVSSFEVRDGSLVLTDRC